MGVKEKEAETASDIVTMLKASLLTLTNVRGDNHPFNSYRYNELSPGIRHSIELIEGAFALNKDGS